MFDSTAALSASAAANAQLGPAAAQRRRSSYYSIGLSGLSESILGGAPDFDLSKMFEDTDEHNLNNAAGGSAEDPFGAASAYQGAHSFFANASNASSFLPGASAALSSTHDMLSNITGSTSRSEALVNSYASSFQPGHLVEPMPVPVPSAAYAPVTPTSALHSNAHRASMISPKHNSFLSADKRKGGKKANKVISTIKSNRAKPAKTIECKEVPRKETRVKGAVYKIGEERKKWDGRQWRRLCIVEDCCSAARGATDFCIVHGRGEVTRQIVNNEEIEVVTNASRPLVAAVVAPRPSPSDLLQRKRKLDDSQDTGPLRRTMKRFDRSTLESKDDAQHGRGYSVPQISW